MSKDESALAQIVQCQRRQNEAEPSHLYRQPAEVTKVRIKRFGAGDSEKDRAKRVETDDAMMQEKIDAVERIECPQDAGIDGDADQRRNRDDHEPDRHDRTKESRHFRGPARLERKQHDQNDDRQRHHEVMESHMLAIWPLVAASFHREVFIRQEPYRMAAAAHLHDAIVILETESALGLIAPDLVRNPPGLDAPVLYARSTVSVDALRRIFPQRSIWRYRHPHRGRSGRDHSRAAVAGMTASGLNSSGLFSLQTPPKNFACIRSERSYILAKQTTQS